jgi:hypothetical protein
MLSTTPRLMFTVTELNIVYFCVFVFASSSVSVRNAKPRQLETKKFIVASLMHNADCTAVCSCSVLSVVPSIMLYELDLVRTKLGSRSSVKLSFRRLEKIVRS